MTETGRRGEASVPGLISVVIPFAKPHEGFLRQAIDSIVAQTFERWEIVLADDGENSSDTDMVRAAVEALGERARVVTHAQPGNRGISAARNTGIRHARGEFVAFLDADDVYLPHKLEFEVATLTANPEAGVLCTNTQYWFSWSAENGQADFVPDLGPTGVFQPPELAGRWLSGAAAVPAPCSFTARRTAIEQVQGFEERFRGLYEDQVFLVKVALTQRVMLIDNVTASYRQHPASMCAAASAEDQLAGRLTFMQWVDRYAGRTEASFPQLDAIIDREFWKIDHPRLAKARRMVRKALHRAMGERAT